MINNKKRTIKRTSAKNFQKIINNMFSHGCFLFYLSVFRHFFHSWDETSRYSSGNADGRIFLKCCQCTMMNRLLPVDYMSNYRVDCMHPVITYGIGRTKRYYIHGNRKEPNDFNQEFIFS